jgi:hypothetical protein
VAAPWPRWLRVRGCHLNGACVHAEESRNRDWKMPDTPTARLTGAIRRQTPAGKACRCHIPLTAGARVTARDRHTAEAGPKHRANQDPSDQSSAKSSGGEPTGPRHAWVGCGWLGLIGRMQNISKSTVPLSLPAQLHPNASNLPPPSYKQPHRYPHIRTHSAWRIPMLP